MDKILKSLQSLFRKMPGAAGKPKERLQRIMREMNEKIPLMNQGIALLMGKKRDLEMDLQRLKNDEEKLAEKKRAALKAGRTGLVRETDESMDGIRRTRDSLRSELDEIDRNYIGSLKSMNGYIKKMRGELQKALASIKDNERTVWQDEYASIMKHFNDFTAADEPHAIAKKEKNGPVRKGQISEDSGGNNHFLLNKIRVGAEKVRDLRSISEILPAGEMKKKIEEVLHLSEKILDDLGRNPEKAGKVRLFLSYYLDATISVLRGYLKLSTREEPTPEVMASMKHAESVIQALSPAYRKLITKMLEDDLMNLDTEIAVLEKALKSDGYA